MRTIYLETRDPYIIGKTGESQKTALRVNVEEWYQDYPSGAGVLLFVRPNKVTYPLETNLVEHEGKHYLETIVTTNETKLPGWVVITAQWYDGETLLHGRTYSGKVLTSNGTNVTDGVQETTPTWVAELIARLNAIDETAETVNQAYANAQEALESIGSAIETATQTVAAAEEAAEEAEAASTLANTYKTAAAASAASAEESAESAMSATPTGYSNLVASIADTYSSSSAYAVGDMALKDSVLYKCNTAIDEGGETWTAGHWTAITVGGQLAQFAKETDAVRSIASESVAWSVAETGKRQNYDDGTLATNTSYAVTGFVDISRYKYLLFGSVTSTAETTQTGAAFFEDMDVGSYISGVPGYEDWAELTYADKFVEVPEDAKYIRFTVLADTTEGFHVDGYVNTMEAVREMLKQGGMYPDTYLKGWLQGTIKTDTGASQSSASKCRSAGLIRGRDITQNGKAVFTVKDGYTLGCRQYTTSAGTTEVYSGAEFDAATGTFEAKIDPDLYYRFVIGNTASAAMPPSNVPSDAVKYTGVQWTDKTLAGYGVPADSSVTGEILRSIGSAIGNAEYYLTPNFATTGGITPQGANAEIPHRIRTAYTKIVPGNHYFIDLGTTDYKFYNVFIYSGTTQGSVIRQLPVIDGRYIFFKADAEANYFRAAFYYSADPDGHDFTTEDVEAISSALTIKEVTMPAGKQERTGTYEWFTVTVDRPMAFGGDEQVDTQDEIECVLQLPTGYTANGTPTRLVLACHGAEGYIDSANEHWAGTGWAALMGALLNAGYAVFDVNVLPTSTGSSTMGFCVGSPLAVNVAKKAYDYIQRNYNVYREIFVHGTSMGGTLASAFSNAYPGLVLAESSLAGRDAALYFYRIENGTYGDSATNFANAWGYETMAALKVDNWSHIEGAAQLLTLHKYVNGVLQYPPSRETDFNAWMAYYAEVQKHTKTDEIGDYTAHRIVPYKTWESWGDSVADTKAKLILQKAYRANGCLYEVVVYDSYDHDDIGFGKVENLRDQLIAWYKRWE